MRSRVYVVPGFLGCSLRGTGPIRAVGIGSIPFLVISLVDGDIWLNVPRIQGGGMYALSLDTDGVTPLKANGTWQPYDALPCRAGIHVLSTYELMIKEINKDRSLFALEFDFDWRLDMRLEGQRLANLLLSERGQFDDFKIVGHSQGAIIARWCWYYLVQLKQQSLISRIVTLGGPHYGLYNSASVFLGLNNTTKLIKSWSPYNTYGEPMILPSKKRILPTPGLMRIAGTWPSMYQLFPPGNNPKVRENDPLAFNLLQPGMWPDFSGVQPDWLNDTARTYIPTFYGTNDTFPPYNVLTTVAGTGFPTAGGLNTIVPFNVTSPFFSVNGDDSVPYYSQHVVGAKQYDIRCDHMLMQSHPDVIAQINHLLIQDNTTPVWPSPVPPSDSLTKSPQLPQNVSVIASFPLIEKLAGHTYSPLTTDP
jgi:pimeloyl-ACP methyl ester carboxylesterase